MNMIQLYNLYCDSDGECSIVKGEKNKVVSEVVQLRTELASLQSIHDSPKLKHDIISGLIKNIYKQIAHLRRQFQNSYRTHVRAYLQSAWWM